MMVAFVLPKSSHNTIFATLDINKMCVDEEDDFGPVMCTIVFIYLNRYVVLASSVPSGV
jgi:hypothetical protein